MKERPILFSAPMVRAILAGTKTQTRRIVKGAPEDWAPIGPEVFSPTVLDRHGEEQPGPDAYGAGNADGDCWIRCPYGQPGDRLWVREAWAKWGRDDQCGEGPSITHEPIYRADNWPWDERDKWRPSIHMPRAASRITLEVTAVRVERLQAISEADALAEGAPGYEEGVDAPPPDSAQEWSFRASYQRLWDQINGAGSWDGNPWVWVVEFRRAQA